MLQPVPATATPPFQPPPIPRLVLIIDEEPLIRLSLGRMLRLRGFVPIEAATMAEAVQISEQHAVEAVILDLGRSSRDSGLDFLAWFRAQPEHGTTPAVVLTGELYLEEEQLASIRQFRAMVFYKPVPFATLEQCLADLFTRDVRRSAISPAS